MEDTDSSGDHRRSGMLLDEDFNVYEEQKETDEELSKAALQEIAAGDTTGSAPTSPTSQPEESKEKPERPPVPIRVSSRQPDPNVLSVEQLEKEYADIARYKIFQLAGDDLTGRPVIAFSACRLPVRNLIDHQKLFNFLKLMLDQYVENDYTIVYFHYGLNSQNKPSLKWLLNIYRELERKYRKNLKALYIVHPSNFIKIIFNMFYPLISTKFGRKINNIKKLDELAPHIRLDQLDIPKEVRDHDEKITVRMKPSNNSSIFHTKLETPKTQVFGISLKTLKERTGEDIPEVVRSTVQFIEQNALDVEGIFRRSPHANSVKDVSQKYNHGEQVTFSSDEVHLPAAILKKFLRELPDPLLTFELYDQVMDACSLPEEERLSFTQDMMKNSMAEENRIILSYLMHFLQKVVDHSSANRMTSGSLAIVFGPNILWSRSEASTLTSMSKVNSFCKYLIDNTHLIFDESVA
ncbi:rho GTPase-activating protein 1-like [Clytia hemisphaerica]|uniref:Rho GTPase activating protein n=1 Tax=Clytia hemisphaerica TaxID=252671 RepID=A0A7M5WWG3_9CNID|eukprot:TCONS_00004282-protein